MKSTSGRVGRVFVLRLEDGDVVPGSIERFAEAEGVSTGQVILVGGIGSGEVVVGPRETDRMPPDPMALPLDGVHEVVGVGVLAPDERGRASLHMHAALGRSGATVTGCVRLGVRTWVMCEALLFEIVGADVARAKDPATGFSALEPRGPGAARD